MAKLSPISLNKKVCDICGNRVRGKRFVFYDEVSLLDGQPRECIPICKGCDSLVSIYTQTFSLWYGLFRIDPIKRLRKEERKQKQKRKK